MTIIASHCSAKLCASDCRIHVALHIVSKISAFVHSFFYFSLHGVQILSVDVVCETKVTGFLWIFFPFLQKNRQFRLISEDFRTNTPACDGPDLEVLGAPMMMTCRPRSLASFTISWIFGHLHTGGIRHGTAHGRQSVIDFLPSPWERMMTPQPGGTSSRLDTQPTPWAASWAMTWSLWDHRPQHHIGAPLSAISWASFTARRTPKQSRRILGKGPSSSPGLHFRPAVPDRPDVVHDLLRHRLIVLPLWPGGSL